MNEVTISQKEYNQLLYDSELLELLRSYGIDCWEGWEETCAMMEKLND